MAPSYPYLPYFWAAYGVTALILLVYGISLYRRYLRTVLGHVRAEELHDRDQRR